MGTEAAQTSHCRLSVRSTHLSSTPSPDAPKVTDLKGVLAADVVGRQDSGDSEAEEGEAAEHPVFLLVCPPRRREEHTKHNKKTESKFTPRSHREGEGKSR